jgi:hypothetical protein
MTTGEQHHRERGAVRAKARRVIADTWQSQANLSLFLGILIAFAFLFPILGLGHNDIKLYADLAFTMLLISGVAIAWGHKVQVLISGTVACVAIASRWGNWFSPSPKLQLWADSWSLAAIVIIAFILLAQVFQPGRVTHVRIQGAIAAYLLFGAGYAHAYHMVAVLQPHAFNIEAGLMSNISDWVYYSFVTLTTVGYGDITPVTPTARILSVGEALTGQLYLAVLVARLVAMEVISWQESNKNSGA